MAVASLVLGIVSLVLLLVSGVFYYCIPLPLVLGVLAWVFGRNALIGIEMGQGNPNERGIATAGMVMGIISTVLCVLVLCCVGALVAGVISFSIPFWQELQRQLSPSP